ncbi:hypothetical protein LTR56_007928 [Elasticomyces elasticus]|nr:hypothetical protein LTR22_022530 [Elasticomyces elasticus]KAK3647699.1 hypothetical protein LTR56_007928 [Elasticomyces elasticus]KAK4908116.1 hypothetical protein LTR49_022950 [Elasticomyces elasticus]KAK5748085.1 hypothetical protein LTS12_021880 [Elasticomyces elasticus]
MQRRGWSATQNGWRCSRYSTEAHTTLRDDGVKTRPQAIWKSPLHHERDISARHLLRSLLRESTYLPDSHARTWTHQHILSRFRKYTFKVWEHRDDPAYETHIRERLGDGRHSLGLLRRANEGERKPLLKVLLMAYGRVGKRRWELMVPLMPKAISSDLKTALKAGVEAATDPKTDAALPNTHPKPPQQKSATPQVNAGQRTAYVPEFTPQLRALLESQIKIPPPHLTRPPLRRLTPKISPQNSWLRPLHPSRVKNQTKNWYADTLSKVHAPLPLHEWQRLRDLASGAQTERMRPRRTAVVEERSALEMVVMYGKVGERKVFGNREGHAITKRFMRRIWGVVFGQCPVMEWSGDTGRWKVTWGQQALGSDHALPTVVDKEAATNVG